MHALIRIAIPALLVLSPSLAVRDSWAAPPDSQAADRPIRVGFIGCDTSHAPKYTSLIRGAKADDAASRMQVVAAFPAVSDDLASSRDRIEKYTEELRKLDVDIVDSVDALLPLVDAVMIESVDGRKHLSQLQAAVAAGKPVFIDKPVAASLEDTLRIYDLAAEKNIPCFSSSALRFSPQVTSALSSRGAGAVTGCDSYSPCHLEPHHPDLFWYGIHGVEILFTVMGPGCESVSRTQTDDGDFVVGVWKDGRIGTFRGPRKGAQKYGATIYGQKGVVACPVTDTGYAPLLNEVAKFFETGKPPVSAEQTIELVAFMEAADESKRRGGTPVKLAEVLEKARAAVAQD